LYFRIDKKFLLHDIKFPFYRSLVDGTKKLKVLIHCDAADAIMKMEQAENCTAQSLRLRLQNKSPDY
jgi:hypothetical protein